MLTSLRLLFFNSCALFLAGYPLIAEAVESNLQDGLAMVTSRWGDVALSSPGAQARRPELHAVKTLTGSEITTGKGDYIFFALSNGMGLGVYENAHLQVKSYLQQPYSAERESIEHEPTRSKLVVELFEGSLSFSAEQISPLSEIVIQLPKGKVRIQKASGRVIYNHTGSHISILRGIVSYDYPGTEEQEFIHGANRVRISDESAMLGRIAESHPIIPASSSRLTERLVEATRYASKRVLYRVNSDGTSIPRPVLVATPEALQQPTPRPYRYLD